jgi:hypothetical protein
MGKIMGDAGRAKYRDTTKLANIVGTGIHSSIVKFWFAPKGRKNQSPVNPHPPHVVDCVISF